jgi:hypothetical protein
LSDNDVFSGIWRYDGTEAVQLDKIDIYLNGGSNIISSVSAGVPAALTAGTAVVESGGISSASSFFEGELAEWMIFSRALTDDEINNIGNYFNDHYSLPWTNI